MVERYPATEGSSYDNFLKDVFDEKTANGAKCGWALLYSMTLWNVEKVSEPYFAYRRKIQERADENRQLLSDLFQYLDGQLKHQAVTNLVIDAGKIKPDSVTTLLVQRILDLDFIMDSFYTEAHENAYLYSTEQRLPDWVNNWMPFLSDYEWSNVKDWKYKSAFPEWRADDPEDENEIHFDPLFSDFGLKNFVAYSHFGEVLNDLPREERSTKYKEALKALQKKAQNLWLENAVTDKEIKGVLDRDSKEIVALPLSELGKFDLDTENIEYHFINDEWLNKTEGYARLYSRLGTPDLLGDVIPDNELTNEDIVSVPASDVDKGAVKKVLNKIKNGSELSDDEEELKKRFAGADRTKEDKKRFRPYVSEWLKENYGGDLKNLAQRLKNTGVVRVDEAMQSIGCDEWFFSLLKGSFLWHCNTPAGAKGTGGKFYDYFPNATVDIGTQTDEARNEFDAFVVTEK
tara:strand:- start:427 stop:1806 length:1380 start_codon:yes stop_codon:yes gene_type:complete